MEGEVDYSEARSLLDELMATHRKEKKDLQAKATSMKHSVAKGDKKHKKEVTAEIEKMEKELKDRHARELAELELSLENSKSKSKEKLATNESEEIAVSDIPKITQHRISKAQKRKEKKMEAEKRRLEAEAEDRRSEQFAPGRLEMAAISRLLSDRGLSVHEIPPDGDCLFNAVAHQLSLIDTAQASGSDMRRKAATYIRAHKEDFLPFLTGENGEPIDEFEFEQYCGKVDRSCNEGGQWGGEPELRALSNVLERRIEVVQPEGRSTFFGEEFLSRKPLTITFHRFAYNLGEHYNSTEPLKSLIS